MRKNCNRIVIENYYEPCILATLLNGPSYGYAIQKQIESQLMCQVNRSNVYRCLSELHAGNAVTKTKEASAEGPERVVYRITPGGKALLKTWVAELTTQKEIVNKLIINCTHL
ncbi:PadR family transcriptional regulator [Candidatus Woesebacteria bacterium]|nr:PadR family transcriptional regulator [Candidatus Woesebacteria bacterium]